MIRRIDELYSPTHLVWSRGVMLALGVCVATLTAVTWHLMLNGDIGPFAAQDNTRGEAVRLLYDGPPSPSSGAGDIEIRPARRPIVLCQAYGPVEPHPMYGADSLPYNAYGPIGHPHFDGFQEIPWQVFAQGEYIGPHRPQHVPEYRVRVDDILDFVYRLTRELTPTPYKLNVGDSIRVESLTDEKIDRELVIQPDGSVTLRLLGQVRAADRTVDELRQILEEQYKKYYKVPAMTVTPVRVDTRVQDLISSINNQFSAGVQSRRVRVTPEGTVQLPAVGSVPAQGLTLDELKFEIDERYAQIVSGIEVMPILFERAPRFLYVVGEVRTPGRFTMEAPTTVMQAIALAGGWNVGGNLREVVIFRRGEDWRLIATKLDIRAALLGRTPTPAGEIWLRDSDVVVVPKSHILLTDHLIELVFTRGIYGVLPISGSYNINSGSRL